MRGREVTDFFTTVEEMGKGLKHYAEGGDHQTALLYLSGIERGLQVLREHLQNSKN